MLQFTIKKTPSIALVLICVILAGVLLATFLSPCAFAAESSVHTYTESTEEIVNPAAGFYKRVTVRLYRNSPSLNPSVESNIADFSQHYGILQLCFDLANFSANAGGVDVEIDDNALFAIGKVFGFLRKYKVGAIVRFDYDRDGNYGNREPDLNLVLSHVSSVAGVISQYSDVILGVESGMLGPWGEQHSTALASSGAETYYKLVQKWLDNTPSTMGIAVRRPLYFTYWANKAFNLNLSVSDLATFDLSQYSQAKRVGVFNDGYLGSSSDLGTFTNRAAETAFIGKQAEHTYYGGELVADGSLSGVVGNYNSVSNLEQEGYVTHTSYLNRDWNDNVFKQYEKTTYTGSDPLYNGKTDELTFVKNRLGYRLYLSQSYNAVVSREGEATFKLTIANAGFARILVPSTSELVFTNDTKTETVPCSIDLSQVPSGQSTSVAGTKEFEITVPIPEQLPNGSYDVYLRFYTEYGAEIRMANDLSICAPNRQGVKLAAVTKSAPVTLSGIAVTTQPTKTIYAVGEQLDLTGLAVTATYSDGSTELVDVTAEMLSDYNMYIAGAQTVKITYEGTTAAFDITVKEPIVLTRIAATYSGKQYYTSGSFDKGELTVKATYSDGTDKIVTDYALSAFDMTAGTKTITVMYSERGVTKTATFSFIVNEVTVTSIAITSLPAKVTYAVGESIDLTGLVVTATYSDGTTAPVNVNTSMLSGCNTAATGAQTATITYKGTTVSFSIKVGDDNGPSPNTNPAPSPSNPSKSLGVKDIAIISVAAAVAVVFLVIIFAVIRKKKK